MRIWNKQQLVIVLSMVVMVGAFILLRYFPMQQKLGAARQAKQQQQAVATKTTAQVQQLPLLTKEIDRLKEQVSNFDTKVPHDRQLGSFLQQMADVMDKHNLTKQSVQPGKEVQLQLQDINCIPINIQCKGRLRQVFSFFKSLKQLDRMIRIEQVELKSDSNFTGEISVLAKAAIYYKAG